MSFSQSGMSASRGPAPFQPGVRGGVVTPVGFVKVARSGDDAPDLPGRVDR